MLKPREADIPALFVVLIVLPIITYILLGKWNEASKKNAKISLLARRAAEEALRAESMASADVLPGVPSLKSGIHVCAKCFAPATTRCARCKSVRYCSGKCQIIHWRQGHSQECQQRQTDFLNFSSGLSPITDSIHRAFFAEGSRELIRSDAGEHPNENVLPDFSDEAFFSRTDYSLDPQNERKLLDHVKRARGKLRREISINGDESCSGVTTCADARFLGLNSQLSAENFHKDTTFELESEPRSLTATNGSCAYDMEGTPISTKLSTAMNSASESQKVPHENKKICMSTNPIDLPEKATSELQKVLGESTSTSKHRYPTGPPENSIDEIDIGKKSISIRVGHEDGLPLSFEVLKSVSEEKLLKDNISYKKPPYTLDSHKAQTKAPSQNQSQVTKKKCYVGPESKSPQHAPTSLSQQSCIGVSNLEEKTVEALRNSSKIHKRSFGGLINSYKKIKVLFPYEDLLKLFECKVSGISPRGLLNCGNSCYANAVLQCLTFTKPLMVYLLRRSHSRTCRIRDWCLMCELEQHTSLLLEGGGPLSPSNILLNMRSVGCRMGGGNQEDAHEFLRLLVMSMQAVCLVAQGGEKKVDSGLQETTLVQQVFGGRLKSKVKCLRCHQESERYENIMDLTLEIYGWVESLEDALTQFTTPEDLDGENMYRCGRCSAYVRARKQLSLHEVPNILTIVLKRFQTGKYGKINKCVTFPDLLDMIPFVSGGADSPPLYMLYAVVVHLDTLNTSYSGHYVSYVKDTQGTWFRIDDSEVQVVSSSQVMSEGAYMLFYSRCFPRPPRAYVGSGLLQAPSLKHNSQKSLKSLRHGSASLLPSNSVIGDNGSRHEKGFDDWSERSRSFLRKEENYLGPVSTDFSDATSSEWSLFTSSDDSSFTTESNRDSFSTIDHGDSPGLDPISSIFGPFYVPESAQGSGMSCTKSSPSGMQTGFHRERPAFISDSTMPNRQFRRCT
ncbi:Ubiquitin carboxyl-terminal hydrolase 15 [Platanthera guangdongensis]|uniref:Ubiquitin carboxyl-terminal hydrolase 15 n=1 Tax=Platanthera guangdongensis TaxID=2320717 RepID=A0ABR2LHR9_9ASPA